MAETQAAFLQELAEHVAYWSGEAVDNLSPISPDWMDTEDREAFNRLGTLLRDGGAESEFRTVIAFLLKGLVHSVLVTFDGGTALAEKTLLTISDDQGRSFDRYLHELWPEFVGGPLA